MPQILEVNLTKNSDRKSSFLQSLFLKHFLQQRGFNR